MSERDRITMPARLGKEAQLAYNDTWPGDLVSQSLQELTREATCDVLDGIRAQLECAMLEAFRAGQDFVVGPWQHSIDPGPFEPVDIFSPRRNTLEVKAGPVERDSIDELPIGFRLYRVADWQDAVRSGRTKCLCSPDVVERVQQGGTCGMGGCPYGGDF